MVEPEALARRHRSSSWRTRLIIGGLVVAVAVAAAIGGYLAGAGRSHVITVLGTAHAGEGQVSIVGDDGWTYSVPSDVLWSDGAGTVHEGNRPPTCLPPVGGSARVKFDEVQVTSGPGITFRPVVWVYCGG